MMRFISKIREEWVLKNIPEECLGKEYIALSDEKGFVSYQTESNVKKSSFIVKKIPPILFLLFWKIFN